jgi:hypothetical protein
MKWRKLFEKKKKSRVKFQFIRCECNRLVILKKSSPIWKKPWPKKNKRRQGLKRLIEEN